MGIERPLSTLELTALGIVLKRGPCVAHAVVAEFGGSATMAYRSGAGSIYPLMKRLTEAGLLATDGRRYTITEAGKAALRDWMRGPFEGGDVTCCLDDLRSRAYFLKLLSPEEALGFATSALARLRELRERCEATRRGYEEAGDPFSELAMRGTIHETDARIAWMTELLNAFKDPGFWSADRPS